MLKMAERKKTTKDKRGRHPNSKENLKKSKGRPQLYEGEKKQRHEVGVTDTAWQAIQELAEKAEITASELIERIGRNTIDLEAVRAIDLEALRAKKAEQTAKAEETTADEK